MEGKKYHLSCINNDCIHPQNAHLLGFTQVLMKFIKTNGNIAKGTPQKYQSSKNKYGFMN